MHDYKQMMIEELRDELNGLEADHDHGAVAGHVATYLGHAHGLSSGAPPVSPWTWAT